MSTLKKTADGKVDKRTKEYKELVERAKKARMAKARASKATGAKTTKAATSKTTATSTTKTARATASTTSKTTTSSIKRRADGKVDLRTKEGKAVAERMAKARASKEKSTGFSGLLKKLLK